MLGKIRAMNMTLEPEPRGLEPSISGSDVVSDSGDECYETDGSCLAARLFMQQTVKHEQPMTQGSKRKGPPL